MWSHTAGINLAMFKYSQQKNAAFKFVDFMTSDWAQTQLNKGYGTLPTIKSPYEKEAFSSTKYQMFRKSYAHHSKPMPLVSSEGQMESSLGNAIVGLIAKAATKGSVSDEQIMSALKSAQQLEQAAMVDGTTPVGALFRVILPVAKPGIVAVCVFAFITAWGEVLFASVLTTSSTRTLAIGLQEYVSRSTVYWNQLMAASIVVSLPVVAGLLALQRYLVRGLTAGSVK